MTNFNSIRNVAQRHRARMERIAGMFDDLDAESEKAAHEVENSASEHQEVLNMIQKEVEDLRELSSDMRTQLGNVPHDENGVRKAAAPPPVTKFDENGVRKNEP